MPTFHYTQRVKLINIEAQASASNICWVSNLCIFKIHCATW